MIGDPECMVRRLVVNKGVGVVKDKDILFAA
jgi:hypothetical protein